MCPNWDNVPVTPAWLSIAARVEADALSAGVRRLRGRDLRRWHRDLFIGVVPHKAYAGRYRQPPTPGTDACLAQEVMVGRAAGASHLVVPRLMQRFLSRANQELTELDGKWGSLDRVARVGMLAGTLAHLVGEFVRIHPFINGNGRTSRLLWRLMCRRLNFNPCIAIAPRPQGDYEAAMAPCMRGDYVPLTRLIIKSIVAAKP